jgi:rare lipoprotein A
MTIQPARIRAAHILTALTMAGLMSSSAGRAVVPLNVEQVVAEATDAKIATLPVVEEQSAAEHVGDGEASYYGKELAGNRTASGERFNPRALTAAHRTLPLGTKLRVTNKANGESVVVRINDRGPFHKSRLIDVSFAAAEEIGMIRSGKAPVRLERLR